MIGGDTRKNLGLGQERSCGCGWATMHLTGRQLTLPGISNAWLNLRHESSGVDYRWKGARNALAGLFCASLNSLDDQRTTSPACAFSPEGFLPNWTYGHQLRHAYLPSERVCTENLTPFLKLLPCKSLSGIAKLLNPHRLFDATWHGLGVHVQWHPKEGVEVRLTFQIVSDPVRSSFRHQRGQSFFPSLFHVLSLMMFMYRLVAAVSV
jgi:hypothetical protein